MMHIPRATTRALLPTLIFVVLAATCWIVFFKTPNPPGSEVATSQTNGLAMGRGLEDLNPNPAAIQAAADSLSQSTRAEDSRAGLAILRSKLDSLGVNSASLAVRQYLDSVADASTHLEFKLSPEGRLKEAPSLRLFLLDYLMQIDPQAAAAYAEKLFRWSNSPDEWAIGLRAYALANPGPKATAFLQEKVREMLRNDQWREHPSAGFLEAFDVIVYTRDQEMTADLVKWVRQTDSCALSHAAYLTLDRLIQDEPVAMLNQFQSQPDLLKGREAMRADLFARTDVRDAQQRQVLENYLLDARRSEAEWQAFAAIYPNGNYMVSHNLLTQTRTPTGDEIAARDREALKVTQEWLGDPRFASHDARLRKIKGRLEQFLETKAAPK